MRKIVAFINLTLDGVMQSPGRPEEDTRGGFQHGGWGAPYGAMQSQAAQEALADRQPGPLLFGRWTYEEFFSFWPKQGSNPFNAMLTNAQKYVASTTLKEPLPWENSILLKGSLREALTALKAEPGGDFLIMGSGVLIQSLMADRLIDLYVLLIHPIVLGSGRRLFPDGGVPASLKLVSAGSTPEGVAVLSYHQMPIL